VPRPARRHQRVEVGHERHLAAAPPAVVHHGQVLVLLPPSEGKAAGGRGRWSPAGGAFGGPLVGARSTVADAVVAALDDRRRLFGTDGPLADRAVEAAQALAAGTAPSLPAWKRFTGVVWEHLDPASLPATSRRRILVPSAQLGLVRGDDPTPDLPPEVRRLVARPRPPRPVVAAAADRGPRRHPRAIVDLLPNEHAAAVDLTALPGGRRVVRVDSSTPAGEAPPGTPPRR
jgi:hypothetical protein